MHSQRDSADAPGAQVWVGRFNGNRNSPDASSSIARSPDGTRIFVTGHSGGKESGPDWATVAYSAATGRRLWVARFSSLGGDFARSLAVSPDGTRVFVTGSRLSVRGGTEYATVAYNAATGARLWVAAYSGQRHESAGYSVQVSPNGARVFAAGWIGSEADGFDYLTIAHNAVTGKRLWVARYTGISDSGGEAFSLAVSPGGARVFVTGFSWGRTSGDDYATVAYQASTGRRLWVARYNGSANQDDKAWSVRVSPDRAKVFVTGESTGPNGALDYATIAYNATTGRRVWVSRYNGPGNADDSAASLRVNPRGTKVFVTGKSTGSTSGLDYATVAYNANSGKRLWASRYNGPASGDDFATSLGMSRFGAKLFVTGTSGDDYATIAYSAATGMRLWTSTHEGQVVDSLGASVVVARDGTKVFVAGTVDRDYATIAYSGRSGTQLWESHYNHADGTDIAYSLGVSPDGARVFATGPSAGPDGDTDYATVANDARSGKRLWAARYDGTQGGGDDAAFSLGVSPDGSRVFVSGRSAGAGTGDDFATIAYDAATGEQLWVVRYNSLGEHHDQARSLGVSPDGTKVFVTGSGSTVAYDADTGAELWVAGQEGTWRYVDFATSLGVSPDGATVFVTGEGTWEETGVDFATVAYDADTGVQRWATRYNGPANGDDYASWLGVSPDGARVFVTGSSDQPRDEGGSDYATVAYDAATGVEQWASRYDGPASADDYAWSLGVNPDGATVFVTGQSPAYEDDYATVAYGADDGVQLWVARYDGPTDDGGDAARSLSVSRDGTTVFVTGFESAPGVQLNYATVAYDAANGTELWLARYDGPAKRDDEAWSVQVSPDGSKVYVAGFSRGVRSGYDFATVAYSTG